MKKGIMLMLCALALITAAACGRGGGDLSKKRVMHTAINKILSTLDPALAADTACQYMTASFYDTPLQYSFDKRPYTLEPSMLESMPEISEDMTVYTCRLRKDLLFQKNECFGGGDRRVTAKDMVFSILRLADTRVGSTGYWLIRGKIKGLDDFRALTAEAAPGDLSVYDHPCPGIKTVDEYTFRITLTRPDPRFVYALAMPYFSAVSRRAVEYYGDSFADHPAGSGPFIMTEWQKDFRITMIRNPEYRRELYSGAENVQDRSTPLPLLDEIDCSFVKQPLSGWLMFLQGELDSYVLDGENAAAVVDEKMQLAPTLTDRGITLLRTPQFETNYIGFNCADPILGKNQDLRRAITLAFDKDRRIRFSAGRLIHAYGPVPPGAAGNIESPGRFGKRDLALAKEYMRRAGYPDGIDPSTGNPLRLEFDQAGSDTFYLQTAELMALDMKEIGIELVPCFNNRARFIQKLQQKQSQLFRFSWTGDYPDAENFLQLFYGPNSGTSNRACFSDPAFNAGYEKILSMPPSPERDAEYVKLSGYIVSKCPWIFESHTAAFILKHGWTENLRPHDFAFNRWKYMSVNPEKRKASIKEFTPLSMDQLRRKND